jgi:hypothetical protein
MARIVYQGQPHEVPEEMDGDQLFQRLEVLPGHGLVAMRLEGNFLVSRQRKVRLADGDQFMDAPTFEYGR